MCPAVTTVFLDAGETLLHPRPSFAEAFVRICAEGGFAVDLERARQIERLGAERYQEYQRRGLIYSNSTESSRAFWIGLYRDFLTSVGTPARYMESLPDFLYSQFTRGHNYCLFDDALPALRSLRQLGLRIGLLSNWESWLERLLSELGIAHLFDYTIISGVVGFEKPDPRIFELALRQAGVPPHEAVHVGDSLYSDVHGAQAVGITPILIDRHGFNSAFAGCARVTTLDDLAVQIGLLR